MRRRRVTLPQAAKAAAKAYGSAMGSGVGGDERMELLSIGLIPLFFVWWWVVGLPERPPDERTPHEPEEV